MNDGTFHIGVQDNRYTSFSELRHRSTPRPSHRQIASKFILIAFFAGLLTFGAGSCLERPWLKVFGLFLAGASVGMPDAYREGVLRTNWWTVRRTESPIHFHIQAVLRFLLIAAWTLGGILVSPGILGKK